MTHWLASILLVLLILVAVVLFIAGLLASKEFRFGMIMIVLILALVFSLFYTLQYGWAWAPHAARVEE